jgi:hypothetical protein
MRRQNFPAGPAGFFRTPVLLSGVREALLIDGGFYAIRCTVHAEFTALSISFSNATK